MPKKTYNQIRILKQKKMVELAKHYPELKSMSGIYMFYRVLAYIGKSSERYGVLGRCASHCISHDQHIDNSIHTRKMSYEGGQWFVKPLIYCPAEEVDKYEREFIEKYKKTYQLLNVESGGNLGKEMISERKDPKGYNKGKDFAREQTHKEISHWFDKYLTYSVKKDGVNARKAYEKFTNFLKGEEELTEK